MRDVGTGVESSGAAALQSAASGGMLAPLPAPTALVPIGPGPFAPLGGSESVAGGLDMRRVWHAWRRSWLPAIIVGLLLAGPAAAAVWFLTPDRYEAVAWLRIRDKNGMMGNANRDAAEYESYRRTQLELVKSPLVMTAALRQPGIIALKTLEERKDDPVSWLEKNILVTAPMDSEVVQVRLRSERPEDVAQIVNAVTKAYMVEVVNKEKATRLAHRDAMERQHKEKLAELRKVQQEYDNLSKTLGTGDSAEVTTRKTLLLDHMSTVRAQLNAKKADVAAIDDDLAMIDAHRRGEFNEAAEVSDDMLEPLLARDPGIIELRDRIAAIDQSMATQVQRSARGRNDPAVRRLEAQRAGLLEKIRERGQELRPQATAQLARDLATSRPGAAGESPAVLRKRRGLLTADVKRLQAEFDTAVEDLKQFGQATVDLKLRGYQVEQLTSLVRQMGMHLEATATDGKIPRVELIEEANQPESSDHRERTVMTVFAAFAGLAFGAGAVFLIEMLRDRLGASEDVTQRVGLRVVGTVPKVRRKRSNHAEVAESVDGVRTLLSQGRENPKVILVTSAVEHEGKTTFASQFAASLARSGRRTLLLDGDLRHPNVHLALELDLRSGLPELLRGEISNDEAVQLTSVDGLFAVTGGSCDYAAITALSRPELAKILKGFRESFDHVVIDAGPVLSFADALLLGQQSDVAIMATMRDVSRLPYVSAASERLRAAGVRVLGAIVNGVNENRSRRRYTAASA